ncbi:MAG: peptidylprolyl isomerase [Acidobacteria bacterium]|nr:peptidylprolyl isomerase [Acidobacteriota bacterium]
MQLRFPVVIAAGLLAGTALAGCDAASGGGATATAETPESQADLPEVVAHVNGISIPRHEFERAVRSAEVRAGQVVPASLRAAIYDRVLDRLIVFHLLLQEARARQLVVDDGEVDAEIDRIREDFPSEEAFEAQLSQWGTSLDELRAERRRDMLIAKLIEADVAPRIAVGDEAVRAFYDQHPDQFAETEAVRASHILIEAASDGAPAERDAARARAEAIRSEALAAGADFGALAREHSDDRATAAAGGELGFVVRGQTVPPFEEALFALQPGEVGPVTESQFGFHVIRADGRRDARVVPFEEAGDGIRRMLVAQARQALAAELVARLRAAGEIETYL